MTARQKFLLFFSIIFSLFWVNNNFAFGFFCATPDYCPATVVRRSWSCADTWHECGTGSFSCATNITCSDDCCAGGPPPTTPPLATPTPPPATTPTPVFSCSLGASPDPCVVNSPASTCTTTISWTANNNIEVYVSLDGSAGTLFGSSGPGTNSGPATWIQCGHVYDFQGRMGGEIKCRRQVTASCSSNPSVTPGLSPAPLCQVTQVLASDGQYADRIYVSWTVQNGEEAQRIDLYQDNHYLTSKSNIDSRQWHFNHQSLSCPVVNHYQVYCWKDGRLYGQRADAGSTLCPTPTSTPPAGRVTPTPVGRPTPTPSIGGPTITPRPTLPPLAYGAWFQSQDGDVHAQGNIADPLSPIPPKIFSLDGEGGFPGVVSFRGGRAWFGSGALSSKDWLTKTGLTIRNFQFFQTLLGASSQNNFNGEMPGGDGIYFAGGDQVISGDWHLAGGKRIIILVNGSVRILSNLVVPYGSSLVLITAGNINFGDQVSLAQGIFWADKKITTGASPVAFEGEGSFVAGQEIILSRDFEDSRNRFLPAEKFVFRPDLIINSDRRLWLGGHVWEELAP